MDSPSRTLTLFPPPQQPPLPRRHSRRDSSNSPEFEFSKLGCNYETTLHSADELFSDGFLLPLQQLHINRSDHDPEPGFLEPGSLEPGLDPSALITSSGSSNPILSTSKRWRDIFKKPDKKPENNNSEEKPEKTGKLEKRREKERKNNIITHKNSSTELNINIWPFSRSRSSGNNSTRSKPVQSNRKVSSAPCSRSNSSGESKSSKKSWPSSPGRGGVHLGRASPVWHVKKAGSNRVNNGNKNRVLKINVPVCIGYRENLSCGSENGEKGGGNNGSNGNLFSLRGFFSKKSSSSTMLTV